MVISEMVGVASVFEKSRHAIFNWTEVVAVGARRAEGLINSVQFSSVSFYSDRSFLLPWPSYKQSVSSVQKLMLALPPSAEPERSTGFDARSDGTDGGLGAGSNFVGPRSSKP